MKRNIHYRTLMVVTGGILSSSLLLAAPKALECRSVDQTHRPYYVVNIRTFDPTFATMSVGITKIKDLQGTQVEKFKATGNAYKQGEVYGVAFEGEKDGQIEGQFLPNGKIVAVMDLEDDKDIEMTCKK